VLGTSTRTSDVLINLGLNPLIRLREVGSPQFGVLSARAPPSPRCTALTAASCENHGAAPNFGTRVPGIFGGNDRFAGKVGFSPDLESTRMWAASLEKAKQPTSASATSEAFGCRCWAFLMLAPACTALRLGSLLASLSRLTHIL
jgi:hypothetical protein